MVIKKICHIISTERRLIYCWVFGQWFNNPVVSTCLLTSSLIWDTGQYACGSNWNIESLAKYPTINYTAFGWNNMTIFLNYQILVNRFVLNLKMWKNSRCHFSYWYSTIGCEVIRLLPGIMVSIAIWILPVYCGQATLFMSRGYLHQK